MEPMRATQDFVAPLTNPMPETGTTAPLAEKLAATEAALEERMTDIAVLGTEIARLEAALARKDSEVKALRTQIDQGGSRAGCNPIRPN